MCSALVIVLLTIVLNAGVYSIMMDVLELGNKRAVWISMLNAVAPHTLALHPTYSYPHIVNVDLLVSQWFNDVSIICHSGDDCISRARRRCRCIHTLMFQQIKPISANNLLTSHDISLT